MSRVMESPLSSFLKRMAEHTDGQLLDQFARDGDGNAFAALVQRHGPMVLGVCRRVLGDPHDADDAFQATFLVLARKARALDKERSLGNYLYTVAHNTALKVKSGTVRRRAHERQVTPMSVSEPSGEAAWSEMRIVLDAELNRLPEKYRAPLVLCYLQGKSNEVAARELGWPSGSMSRRLEKGRQLLRQRLGRRGVALPAAAVATLMARHAAAAVPATLLQLTSRSARLFATGHQLANAGHAVQVAEAMLQATGAARLKVTVAAGLLLCLLGGAGAYGYRSLTAPPVLAEPMAVAADTTPQPTETVKTGRDRALQKKLDQPIDLDKGIDPNTPLKDALEFLAERYELPIAIDSKTFAAFGIDKVEEIPVQVPKLKKIKLATVLWILAQQLRADDGHGAYKIRDGKVVITCIKPAEAIDAGPPPSKEILAKLDQTITLDKGVDANTPLGEVLELIAGMADVNLLVIEAEFQAIGIQKVEELPVQLKPQDKVKLRVILEQLLKQIEGDEGYVGGFVARDDHIDILPVKPAKK